MLIFNSHLYSQEEGILIECMDACFGLSRKRSQGCGFATPKHQDLFFGDQNDVDNFVDHYSELSVSEQVNTCNVDDDDDDDNNNNICMLGSARILRKVLSI